jgi:hypothetical protein
MLFGVLSGGPVEGKLDLEVPEAEADFGTRIIPELSDSCL